VSRTTILHWLLCLERKDRLWDVFLILVKMEIKEVESDGRKWLSEAMKVLEIIIKNTHSVQGGGKL